MYSEGRGKTVTSGYLFVTHLQTTRSTGLCGHGSLNAPLNSFVSKCTNRLFSKVLMKQTGVCWLAINHDGRRDTYGGGLSRPGRPLEWLTRSSWMLVEHSSKRERNDRGA